MIDLAKAAGVTANTVNRLEVGGELHVSERERHGHVSQEVDKIINALARPGVSYRLRDELTAAGSSGSDRVLTGVRVTAGDCDGEGRLS